MLNLGCGAGTPAGIEIARSHRITGVDISPVQVALARARIPAASFLEGDATTITFAPGSFEAVVSCYAFDHIPPGSREAS